MNLYIWISSIPPNLNISTSINSPYNTLQQSFLPYNVLPQTHESLAPFFVSNKSYLVKYPPLKTVLILHLDILTCIGSPCQFSK